MQQDFQDRIVAGVAVNPKQDLRDETGWCYSTHPVLIFCKSCPAISGWDCRRSGPSCQSLNPQTLIYKPEQITMSYTSQQYKEEATQRWWTSLTEEERQNGVSLGELVIRDLHLLYEQEGIKLDHSIEEAIQKPKQQRLATIALKKLLAETDPADMIKALLRGLPPDKFREVVINNISAELWKTFLLELTPSVFLRVIQAELPIKILEENLSTDEMIEAFLDGLPPDTQPDGLPMAAFKTRLGLQTRQD